jgi:hypothetical protein
VVLALVVVGVVVVSQQPSPKTVAIGGKSDERKPPTDNVVRSIESKPILAKAPTPVEIKESPAVVQPNPSPADPIPSPAPIEPLPKKPARTVHPDLLKLKPGSLQGRSGPMRQLLLQEGGGDAKTEEAVAAGLQWLAKQQRADGGWGVEGRESNIGPTGLGLLPLLGSGDTHKRGVYAKNISKGLDYLLRGQKSDGSFDLLHGSMYDQGLATIVICEAYGMSRDERLKLPAQKAINYIVAAQHQGGGWRYKPKEAGDTSVTGWQFMALKAGETAGLIVPAECFQRVALFLDSVTAPDGGYGYQGPQSTPTNTAIGMVCRQYMGWKADRAEMREGIEILKTHSPPLGGTSVYYYYYATQAMREVGGEEWESWNSKMREMLIQRQKAGSWSAEGANTPSRAGS